MPAGAQSCGLLSGGQQGLPAWPLVPAGRCPVLCYLHLGVLLGGSDLVDLPSSPNNPSRANRKPEADTTSVGPPAQTWGYPSLAHGYCAFDKGLA